MVEKMKLVTLFVLAASVVALQGCGGLGVADALQILEVLDA